MVQAANYTAKYFIKKSNEIRKTAGFYFQTKLNTDIENAYKSRYRCVYRRVGKKYHIED
jgi:hypothetical protein